MYPGLQVNIYMQETVKITYVVINEIISSATANNSFHYRHIFTNRHLLGQQTGYMYTVTVYQLINTIHS